MSRQIIDLTSLDPDRQRQFDHLTGVPDIAWPTAVMCVILVATYLSVYFTGFVGLLPLWLGLMINTGVGYLAFSVAHDAIHRAISSDVRINDRIGQVGLSIVLPYVNLKLFRWAHIMHHRYANGDRDPDRVFNGAWWSLPLRWMMIDVAYFFYALNHGDKISKAPLRSSLFRAALFLSLLVALTFVGYGMEILMLWFIPTRLVQLMLGFTFFWLPHVPHDVTQAEHFTRATTVRKGHEWLLSPIMQYQNYHLIHHLFPRTPFYNNRRVYDLIAPELERYEAAVQYGFAIQPEIRSGYVASERPLTA